MSGKTAGLKVTSRRGFSGEMPGSRAKAARITLEKSCNGLPRTREVGAEPARAEKVEDREREGGESPGSRGERKRSRNPCGGPGDERDAGDDRQQEPVELAAALLPIAQEFHQRLVHAGAEEHSRERVDRDVEAVLPERLLWNPARDDHGHQERKGGGRHGHRIDGGAVGCDLPEQVGFPFAGCWSRRRFSRAVRCASPARAFPRAPTER